MASFIFNRTEAQFLTVGFLLLFVAAYVAITVAFMAFLLLCGVGMAEALFWASERWDFSVPIERPMLWVLFTLLFWMAQVQLQLLDLGTLKGKLDARPDRYELKRQLDQAQRSGQEAHETLREMKYLLRQIKGKLPEPPPPPGTFGPLDY